MLNQPGTRDQAARPAPSKVSVDERSRGAGYSSPLIISRRLRILDETQRLIGEVGIHNLCMDEVARRADVAKRTLYNVFQSKEHLIAAALFRFLEAHELKIEYSEAATLDWMLNRLMTIARRNLENRGYTRALMNIYYSVEANQDINRIIHNGAARSHGPWISDLAMRKQLLPWVDVPKLISRLVRYRFATFHAWAEGEIPDEELVVELVHGVLMVLAGATRGEAREEIVTALSNFVQRPLSGDIISS